MSDVAYLRETELALMNAPFDERGWHRAIEMVAKATGSGAAHFAGIGGPAGMPLDVWVGREAECIDDYFSEPEHCGESNWRIRCIGAPMTIQHERHYAAARASGGTTPYDDVIADLDMRFGCQTSLINDERNFLGLALLRSQREGATDDIVYGRFKHLIGHVQRSVRVQLALAGEAAEVMLGEMTTVNCRTVLLDRHGCLSAISPSAEPLFESLGPAKLDGLAFALRNRTENRHLHSAMGRLLSGHPDAPVLHQMRAGRGNFDSQPRWKLSLVRLPDRPNGLGFEPALALSFHPMADEAAALGASPAVH